MMRKLRVWWTIITGIGSSVRASRQTDLLYRYYVLEALANTGLFDYLKEPRTYGQILTQFGFVDSDYTRFLFDVLVNDKHNVIVKEDNLYRLNPEEPLPRLDQIVTSTDKRVHSFGLMAKGIVRYMPARLRNEPIEFSQSFEQDGRQLLAKFDRNLANRIYTTLRNAAFAALTREERKWLRGKELLDVGCGSGRETAELWLKLEGDIHITAIDSVLGLVELAEQNFPVYLDDMKPAHVPLTDANRPVFGHASVTNLPFEDNSFDAAFHSLVLYWTPDPRKAMAEIARVLKPGGLVFGTQATKPLGNPYFDLVVRTNENCYGFFWKEEFPRWYSEYGVEIETITPVGVFRGHKRDVPQSED